MDSIFAENGIFATQLAGYQVRAGQLEMATAIEQLIAPADEERQGGCSSLVIEAETGLGKTLAYLVPAILSGTRVVVSTNTRNLQDQILEREIPLIRQHLDPDLKALCVKGRQNYLCLYRWRQLQSSSQSELFEDDSSQAIDRWIGQTTYADRSELSWLTAASPLWQKICCLSHFCLGSSCPEVTGCFLNRLRRDAAACRLLVVNHHLLFSDLAIRKTGFGEVLPRYETVIFDEAHHIENVATTFFGFAFSRYQVIDLVGDIDRSAEAALRTADKQSLHLATTRLAGAAERFAASFPTEKGRFLLDRLSHDVALNITQTRDDLVAALQHLITTLDRVPVKDGPWEQFADRTAELDSRLAIIMADSLGDLATEDIPYTYWYERTERNLTLFATPVDIAQELQTTLFATTAHCVFTSATLTSGGSFTYFFKRLGLPEDTPSLSLPSPFDYKNRTIIFIPPTDFPEPAGPTYQLSLHACMETLINHAEGRTLALFTSFQAMELAFSFLRDRLPYPLLMQGEAPRRTLLDQFSRETTSVLFAVASFWEGVDIPGESLSLVIIDKLPFEVPSDPVIMARTNRMKAMGENPFSSFQVPRAILTLRQGVGRLMRTASDRGVIAILDTRLFTKGYGRQFLKSMPPSPLVRSLDEVAAFFQMSERQG